MHTRWALAALAAAVAALAVLLAWSAAENRSLRSETARLREEARSLRGALAAAAARPPDPPAAAAAAPPQPGNPATARAPDALAAHAVRPAATASGGPFEAALQVQREGASRARSSPFGRP